MVQRRAGGGLFPAGTMRNILLLSGIFIVSRLIYFSLGVRFLADLSSLLQVADLDLLRHDLFRTVLLLHFQPPLFNLFVGLVLKLAPDHYALAFQAVYLLLGLALAVSIFLLAVRLGLSPRPALLLSGLFTLTPATVLLENWVFYTYPVTLLMVLSALALNLYLESRRIVWLFALFVLAMVLVLTRTMFHPLWLLLIAGGLFLLLPDRRREIVTAALVPLLVIGLWMAKNFYTVGSLTTSTMLGMNFFKITLMQLPDFQRVRMHARGEIGVFGLYANFESLDYYREKTGEVGGFLPTGIPIMDEERTSSGKPNFNHPAYVDISRRFMDDDLAVVRYHPAAYLRGVLGALCLYFQPPHDQIFSLDNAVRLGPEMRVFDVLLYGQFSSLLRDSYHVGFKERIDIRRSLLDVGLCVLAAFLLAAIFWPACLLSGGLDTARGARGLTIWFMLCSLAWVTLLANLLEIGENARLRYPVEPFLWLLVALYFASRGKRSKEGSGGN